MLTFPVKNASAVLLFFPLFLGLKGNLGFCSDGRRLLRSGQRAWMELQLSSLQAHFPHLITRQIYCFLFHTSSWKMQN